MVFSLHRMKLTEVNTMKYNNLITGCLCALGAETLFGLSYYFTKQATDLVSPFAFLGWRFLIAAVAMIIGAATGLIKINLKGKNRKPLLLVAFFNPAAYFTMEILGISNTTASESGVVLACIPIASLIASAVFLHEKPHPRQTAGILVTLAGALVTVFAVGASSSLSVIGYVMLLGAMVAYALYCVCVDKASAFTGIEITFAMMVTGGVVFPVLALIEAAAAGDMSVLFTLPLTVPGFLKAILYTGFGASILGAFLSNLAIAKIGVNRTSSFIGVSTVVSIIAGVLLLQEPFTTYQAVGAVIIMAGIYIANSYKSE